MLDIYLHSLCLDRIDSTDLRYVLSFPPLAKQFDIKLIVSTCSSAVYNCKSVVIAAARYSVISLCCTTCCLIFMGIALYNALLLLLLCTVL